MTSRISDSIALWIKGLAAAAISGAANGVITGFAAVGIDPLRFNLQSGIKPTLTLASVSAMMSALIGTSAYLKQSPLPAPDLPRDFDDRPHAAPVAGDGDHLERDHHDDATRPDDRPR